MDRGEQRKLWKTENKRQYILSRQNVEILFEMLEAYLDKNGCDHTLRYTKEWLSQHVEEQDYQTVLSEIMDMGGFCDCEVLMNCYEDDYN